VRFQRQLSLLINDADDGEGIKLFEDNDQFVRSETAATFCDVQANGKARLAASEADTVLDMGDVLTAKGLMLAFDGQIQVVFNAGADTFTTNVPSSGYGVLYLEADITEVKVTNPSSTAAVNVLYALVGVE
jgi:hypothetical protein